MAALAGCGESEPDVAVVEPVNPVVARIGDGDTIALRGGQRVRLVQIDAPELGDRECYAREAQRELERLTPRGTRVELEPDPGLDDVDRYGRLLRYVHVEGVNVNVALVLRGAATPYFLGGGEGRYSDDLVDAVKTARAESRGMWADCHVAWRSDRPVATHPR